LWVAVASVVEVAGELQGELVQLRRALHREPELGLQLPRTRERVLAALEGLPLEIRLDSSSSSLSAVLRGGGGTGRTVLLRGDMDALPVVERTGLEFASRHETMHACGHDLHTTMLVGAARVLAASRRELAGDVVFMFQAGEEGYDGAGHMIAEGVLDVAGSRADAALAIHVTSSMIPRGMFASRAQTIMSAADVLKVTVRGAGGHGSAPHRSRDPIPAACEMVTALGTFVTRRFDVFDPVVITTGVLRAGTQHNVIPDEAYFEATVRSFSREAHTQVLAESVQVCKGIAAAHGLEVDAVAEELYPVTVNSAEQVGIAESVVGELHGVERWHTLENPLTGSEDFSRILEAVPGAMVFLGACPPDRDPGSAPFNHSAEAVFDDAVLADGAALYAGFAERVLSSG
jgi:amidohydrolase